jgi:hypothetical protein
LGDDGDVRDDLRIQAAGERTRNSFMSTAPNGKIAHAIGAPGRATAAPSVDKPAVSVVKGGKSGDKHAKAAKAPGAKMSPERRKLVMVGLLAVIVVVGVARVVSLYFTATASDYPKGINRIRDPKLPQFVMSNDFAKEPFRRQKRLLIELQDRKKDGEFAKAYKAGTLPSPQYKEILAYAYVGKIFDRMDKYGSLGQMDRKYQLDKWIDEKESDDDDKPEAERRDKPKTVKIIDSFPSEEKLKIHTFQQIIKDREKERKHERELIARAAKAAAASRPTSRPADVKPATGTAVPKVGGTVAPGTPKK